MYIFLFLRGQMIDSIFDVNGFHKVTDYIFINNEKAEDFVNCHLTI